MERPTAMQEHTLTISRSETLTGTSQFRQKAGRVQQGWRRGNGKMIWFDVPQVGEDAPDVE